MRGLDILKLCLALCLQNYVWHCVYKIMFGIVFTKFMVYFEEEFGDFRLCCGRFSPMEI